MIFTKHLTLLIFSLPLTLRIIPIPHCLLSALLITLFFLYLQPCLHLLLLLLPVVVYGIGSDFNMLFSLTFLRRNVVSIPATPVWMQVKLLTACSRRWSPLFPLLLNLSLPLNCGLIVYALSLFRLESMHINHIYILAQISLIKLLYPLGIVARLFFI